MKRKKKIKESLLLHISLRSSRMEAEEKKTRIFFLENLFSLSFFSFLSLSRKKRVFFSGDTVLSRRQKPFLFPSIFLSDLSIYLWMRTSIQTRWYLSSTDLQAFLEEKSRGKRKGERNRKPSAWTRNKAKDCLDFLSLSLLTKRRGRNEELLLEMKHRRKKNAKKKNSSKTAKEKEKKERRIHFPRKEEHPPRQRRSLDEQKKASSSSCSSS